MDNKKFIFLLTQLDALHSVEFTAFGLCLRLDKKGRLSTLLYNEGGPLPSAIKECLSPGGTFSWQQKGAYLSLDDGAVSLVQEIPLTRAYLPFKSALYNFVQIANEWKEIIYSLV